jgi:hypothetical protein
MVNSSNTAGNPSEPFRFKTTVGKNNPTVPIEETFQTSQIDLSRSLRKLPGWRQRLATKVVEKLETHSLDS